MEKHLRILHWDWEWKWNIYSLLLIVMCARYREVTYLLSVYHLLCSFCGFTSRFMDQQGNKEANGVNLRHHMRWGAFQSFGFVDHLYVYFVLELLIMQWCLRIMIFRHMSIWIWFIMFELGLFILLRHVWFTIYEYFFARCVSLNVIMI